MFPSAKNILPLTGKLYLLVAFTVLLPAGVKAQDPPGKGDQTRTIDLSAPLTLDQAIQIALSNQPQIFIARSQVTASKARVTQAESSFYPQIEPSYTYSNQTSRVNSRSINNESDVTQIQLRQLVFDMGKREENVAQSRKLLRSTEFNLMDTRQRIILNVTNAYLDLLRRKELVKVELASVERAKTTLEFTKASVEVGASPRKDILQAQADLDNAQVRLSQAQNNVQIAQVSLKNAMGILTNAVILTPDTPMERPSMQPDTRTSADYLKLAFDMRPDFKSDVLAIEANKHSVKIANINAGLLVEANLTQGYRFDPDRGENRTFITTFSYPLFDAGLTRSQVRQAKASLEQSQQQLELTRQSIQLEVEQAYLLREEARLRIAASEAALKAARENFEAAREAQKEGAGTILDVITAQTQLVTAETNAVQAIFDFYIADARLKRATGENDRYLAEGKNR
jgi:outer membrane protein